MKRDVLGAQALDGEPVSLAVKPEERMAGEEWLGELELQLHPQGARERLDRGHVGERELPLHRPLPAGVVLHGMHRELRPDVGLAEEVPEEVPVFDLGRIAVLLSVVLAARGETEVQKRRGQRAGRWR